MMQQARPHLNVLVDPDSFRLSRLASAAALLAAANSGFALALFSLALIFFKAAFSPELSEVSWGILRIYKQRQVIFRFLPTRLVFEGFGRLHLAWLG